MQVTIIDDSVKEQIKTLIEYAEKHPVSMDDILDIHNNAAKPIGDRPEHSIIIPVDHLITYSIEDHGPTGLVKHLSVMVKNPRFVPSPESVMLIMPLFGFNKGLSGTQVKIEGKEGTHQYISLWEKYE